MKHVSPAAQFGLVLGTGAFWVVAYVLIIRRGFIDETHGMPFVALCGNLGWEFVFAFVYPLEKPFHHIVRVWLALDLVILSQLLMFGRGSVMPGGTATAFVSFVAACIVLATLVIWAVSKELRDTEEGKYAAFG